MLKVTDSAKINKKKKSKIMDLLDRIEFEVGEFINAKTIVDSKQNNVNKDDEHKT